MQHKSIYSSALDYAMYNHVTVEQFERHFMQNGKMLLDKLIKLQMIEIKDNYIWLTPRGVSSLSLHSGAITDKVIIHEPK